MSTLAWRFPGFTTQKQQRLSMKKAVAHHDLVLRQSKEVKRVCETGQFISSENHLGPQIVDAIAALPKQEK